MKKFTDGINLFLSPGPAVFMPIIIFVFCMIIKLFSKKSITVMESIRSGLMLGVAFIGMGMVIGFMVSMFSQPFEIIQSALNFGSLDLGWAPMSAISWAWQYAALMFPIQILINAIMLKLRWTKVLNADMWNVWNKVFTGVIVQYFLHGAGMRASGAIVVALMIGGLQVVFELKNADVMYERQRAISKIPNIVSPHAMFLDAPFIHYIHKFLQRFRFFKGLGAGKQKNIDTTNTTVKSKIVNTLRDNMIIGFLIGTFIALSTLWFDLDHWTVYVQLPFNLAAALVLFPLIAQLFTKSLVPFGMSIQNIMNAKFNNRELYIGLDWPFLAGNPRLWIIATLLMPFEIAFAIAFSFIDGVAMVFPLASLIAVCLATSLLVICEENMKTMFVAGVILVPVYLFFGAMTAPAITDLAKDKIGQMSDAVAQTLHEGKFDITQTNYESPIFRWGFSAGLAIFGGQTTWESIVGIVALPAYLILFIFYYIDMAHENKNRRKIRLEIEGIKYQKEKPPVGSKLFKKIWKKSLAKAQN